MKEKLIAASSRYLVINLAFLPLLPLLRITEYFFVHTCPGFPGNGFTIEILGLIHDLFTFTIFAVILYIPFALIYLWKGKVANIFYIVMICLLAILQLAIIKFFSINKMISDI